MIPAHEIDLLVEQAVERAQPSSNGWWRASCPICPLETGKDGGDTFAAKPNGTWRCFRCQHEGFIPSGFEVLGWTGDEDFEVFAPVPLPVEPESPVAATIKPPRAYIALGSGPGRTAACLRAARRYLESRGLGPAVWEEAEIGAALTGYWRGRIIVPAVAEAGGPWAGWAGRDWTGRAERKYLYPKGFGRGAILHRMDRLRVETEVPALVMEGLFDAVPYGDAVACFGKPSVMQFELLRQARRPICVVLDGDAWREAESLARRLHLYGRSAGFLRLPPRTDPAEIARVGGADWLIDQARRAVAITA